MERNGDSQQDEYGRSRVRKTNEVHKRRIDKETRRAMRQRERDTARDQVQKYEQAEVERQERFTVIHGGRDARTGSRAARREALARQIPNPAEASQAQAGVGQNREATEEVIPFTVISVGGGSAAPHEASLSSDARTSVPEVPGSPQKASESAASPSDADTRAAAQPAAGEDVSQNAIRRGGAHRADARSGTAVPPDQQGPAAGEGQEHAGNAGAYAEDSDEAPPKRPHRARRIILIVIAIIIGIMLVLLGLFSWNRWLRYDDTTEIQGEWFAASSGRRAPITIDGDVVVFNEETKWHYTLDTTAKTITFTFGSQTGGGRYWFVKGTDHLIIEDGVGFSALDTFIADLQRTITGKADEIPQGDTITVLSRSADAALLADAERQGTSSDVEELVPNETSVELQTDDGSAEVSGEDTGEAVSDGEASPEEGGESGEAAPAEESAASDTEAASEETAEEATYDEGAESIEWAEGDGQ